MSCQIIKPGFVTIDGANTYLGGAIGNTTINLSDISGQSTADITLYQQGHTKLRAPTPGGKVVLSVMGESWEMTVGKCTMNNATGSATTMRVTLYDRSHEWLDQNFIVLNEEFPDGTGYDNCHLVGGKYGALPNDILAENYILTGDSDTAFGHLRAYFNTLRELLVTATNSGGAPLPRLLSDEDVHRLTRTSPGKSMYWTDKSSPYPADIFEGFRGRLYKVDDKSLADVLGSAGMDILGDKVELPVGIEMQDTGTVRSVLTALANKVGWYCYWDMQENKVEIASTFNTSEGLAKLNDLAKDCKATGATESMDFTTTYGQGAIGALTSSLPGASQDLNQVQSRYLSGQLLKPVFTYRQCTNVGGARKVLPLPSVNTFDSSQQRQKYTQAISQVAEAMEVARGTNDQWCHFVVEQLLAYSVFEQKKITDQDNWPESCTIVTRDMGGNPSEASAGGAALTYNKFIVDYYSDETKDVDLPCTTELFAIGFKDPLGSRYLPGPPPRVLRKPAPNPTNIKMRELFGLKAEDAANPDEKEPVNAGVEAVGGLWDVANGRFEKGILFGQIKKTNLITVAGKEVPQDSIIGAAGFAEGADALQPYLKAIAEFYGKYYVVKSNGLNTAREFYTGRDYGYLVIGDNQPSMSFSSGNAVDVIKLRPFSSVAECGDEGIQNLAKAMVASYAINLGYNGVPTLEDLLETITTIDFIYALDTLSVPSQAGVGALNAINSTQKINGPRKNSMEKLIQENVNRFGGKSRDGLKDRAEDVNLSMIMLKAKPAAGNAFDEEESASESTLVHGGVTITQKVPKNDDTENDFLALNTILTENETINTPQTCADDDAKAYNGLWCCEQKRPITDAVNFFVAAHDPAGGKSFFKGTRPGFVFDKVRNSERAHYTVQGTAGAFTGDDSGQFYISKGNVPAAAPVGTATYWSLALEMGVSIDAADVALFNKQSQKFDSLSGGGSFYSEANKLLMAAQLQDRVDNNVWVDTAPSWNKSVSIILGEDMTGLILPKWKDGLETISITNRQGKTEVSVTVGDKLVKRAIKAALAMRSKTSTFQHQTAIYSPDPFKNNVSQSFYNKST